MDVIFTEEQEMLRASAREFLDKECTEEVVKEVEESRLGYSPDLWKQIAELGWLGLVYPEQYGGSGMNLEDLAVLYEEFGRASYASPYTSTVILGGLTVQESGSDEQKNEILPEIIRGEKIIAAVMDKFEPKGGSGELNPEEVVFTAVAEGDDYVISGARMFVPHAGIASDFLVPARVKSGSGLSDGITLFLVDAGSPGAGVARLATIPGDNRYEVIFRNVRVPAKNIVGRLHGGMEPLYHSLQIGSVMAAAQMLGAGERLLKLSQEDFDTRAQTGIPGEIKQYNEEYLTRLKQDIEGCRRSIYQSASRLAGGEKADFETAVAAGWSSYAGQNA